jgi:hypothetical protein
MGQKLCVFCVCLFVCLFVCLLSLVCADHMQETSEKCVRVVNLKSSNDNRNRNTVFVRVLFVKKNPHIRCAEVT